MEQKKIKPDWNKLPRPAIINAGSGRLSFFLMKSGNAATPARESRVVCQRRQQEKLQNIKKTTKGFKYLKKMPLDSSNLTQFSDIFGTADTITESEDAEFLSAAEAVKKLEEVW